MHTTYKAPHEQAPRSISDMLTVYQQEEHHVRWVQWHWWFQGLEHLAMAKENFSVQQPSYGMHSLLTYPNLALYIYYYEIIVLYLLYLICLVFFLHKFMYNASEQALRMKRALHKFGIIIIIIIIIMSVFIEDSSD